MPLARLVLVKSFPCKCMCRCAQGGLQQYSTPKTASTRMIGIEPAVYYPNCEVSSVLTNRPEVVGASSSSEVMSSQAVSL
jgi:hypothetical protein